ncbi:MAG: HXXEE domain-containing protein [Bacteroidota bacterium]|nr:HXXEE domain-containing protein [Bacteroidota bacterium]
MSKLDYDKQLLLAGTLFTLHNLEEATGFSRFVYPANLPLAIRPPDADAMIWAIGLLTLIAWGLILWVNSRPKEISRKNLLLIFVSVFIANAIFPHIVGTIVLQHYFPAVITAVILYLPYSILMLPKLYHSYPRHQEFFIVMTGGLSLAVCLTIILHFLINIAIKYLV